MSKLSLQKISEYAFIILPVALITGPLISEICILFLSLFGIYYSYHKKDYEIFKSKIILALFGFYAFYNDFRLL